MYLYMTQAGTISGHVLSRFPVPGAMLNLFRSCREPEIEARTGSGQASALCATLVFGWGHTPSACKTMHE